MTAGFAQPCSAQREIFEEKTCFPDSLFCLKPTSPGKRDHKPAPSPHNWSPSSLPSLCKVSQLAFSLADSLHSHTREASLHCVSLWTQSHLRSQPGLFLPSVPLCCLWHLAQLCLRNLIKRREGQRICLGSRFQKINSMAAWTQTLGQRNTRAAGIQTGRSICSVGDRKQRARKLVMTSVTYMSHLSVASFT